MIMPRLAVVLATLTSIFVALVNAADLKGSITATGITAFFPGDSNYTTASKACTLFPSLRFPLVADTPS